MRTVVTLTVHMDVEHCRGDKDLVKKEAVRLMYRHLDHWIRLGSDRSKDIGPFCVDLMKVE